MASITEQLHDLYSKDFQWELVDNPEAASQFGQHDVKWTTPLQDVSPEGYNKRASHSHDMISQLDTIVTKAGDALSKQDRVTSTLFRSQHSDIIEGITKCPFYLMPVNSIGAGGITFSFLESIEWMRFEHIKDFEGEITR